LAVKNEKMFYNLKTPKLPEKENKITKSNSEETIKEHTNYLPNAEEISKAIFERLKQVDDFSKIRGYSTLRIFITTSLIFLILLYIYWEDLKNNIQQNGNDLVSKTFKDEEVLKKAEELSKYVVSDILIDAEMISVALIFLNSLSQDESFIFPYFLTFSKIFSTHW
jgi:predicted PurR-regulated permease PerM